MKNLTENPMDELIKKLSKNMQGYDTFFEYEKKGMEPSIGAFHGARLGRQVDIPIAVKANSDGTFTVTDGLHRTSQAVISNNENIIAFVDGGSGPTLQDIFTKFKADK